MLSPLQARTLAAYNRSMNESLYGSCARLADEERKRDVGAFFKSIHGTLNHLLVGDRIWMSRFTGNRSEIRSLDQELCADFAELRAQRASQDRAIVEWVDTLDGKQLAGEFTFTLLTRSETRTLPLWFALTHLFNHQTHHRGQVTALLSQCGIDPGVTDLIAFPDCVATARGPI